MRKISQAPRCSRACRILVHKVLGDLRENLVGVAYFIERALQNVADLAASEPQGERPRAAVAGNLVVLCALGSGVLQLAIGMQADYAQNQFPGKYNVKVRVQRKQEN